MGSIHRGHHTVNIAFSVYETPVSMAWAPVYTCGRLDSLAVWIAKLEYMRLSVQLLVLVHSGVCHRIPPHVWQGFVARVVSEL